MKIVYKNNFGTVVMLGEGNNGFSICETDGLNILGKERNLIHFHNKDGYEESDSFWGQRIISISGDIKSTDYAILKNAVKVFSLPGILTLFTDYGSYEITVNDTVFKTTQKNSMYKTYCAQFTCDFPHFSDCTDIFSGVYSRTDNITPETFLPAVFSSRTCGGIVKNSGNVAIEPQIIIKSLAEAPEDGFITIENKTTGKKIIINYKLSADEIITADIPNRTVTSNINGDITSYLSPESYLCDITLICGENNIDVLASDGNRNCEIYVVYRNLYTGVMI